MHITFDVVVAIGFLTSLVVGCLVSVKDIIKREYYQACLIFFVGMFGTWVVGFLLIATVASFLTLLK